MHETELHDLSDDSDYAASQQQGLLSRIDSQKDSPRRISLSDPNGSEIVYFKDNVAIHPTQYASERISGRLRLIKQGSSLFMTWIPYKPNPNSADSLYSRIPEKDRNLYTIRALPFTDVKSIRRHTPTLGWQYIIVVLSSGLAFPPLYFYNGGAREFLATIKQHVLLVRSADDANVFVVNDLQDPLQRSLSSLELPRVISVTNGTSSSSSASSVPKTENLEMINGGLRDGNSSTYDYSGRHRQKVQDPARDLSIQVLEKFSLVTKFARETTTHLFRENHNDGSNSHERKQQIRPVSDRNGGGPDGSSTHERKQQIRPVPDRNGGGPDGSSTHEGKQQMWPPAPVNNDGGPDETQEDLNEISVTPDPLEKIHCRKEKHGEEAATRVGTFELVDCKEFDKLTLVWGKPRQPPLGFEEWPTFLDLEGRITDSKALTKRIFYGGVEYSLRKEVWKFLLGFHAYDSTYAEREYLASIKKSEYETIKCQWQAKRFTKFRERKGLIEKDVVRTDRSISYYDGDDNPNVGLLRDILLTYSFYNFDLGYCQGMSDLLSPILFVMNDESESFWCFVSLMERLGPNFNRDQNGMHSQLFALSKLVELLDIPLHNYLKQADCLNYFFCFRWILIQFKREFEFERVMRLWEVLWTHHLSEHIHLYVCVAILKRYRQKIIGEQMDFDTLLKFINELSGCIDLDGILRDAEALCICAGENGAACIPPGTPPSLPIETGFLNSNQDDDIL
ncbi:rabGAP/TBC domain-containing protein isoform X2 [Tasmannia lanceolata]|uniref:rabGAP/TBC domain-containing protein isoform X2 n=1 Tax=Tasmannia lanceolata TaxID=3420 RepID=UPI004063BD10